MKLCINADFTDSVSFENRIELIKSAGFDSVMMSFKDAASFRTNVGAVRKSGLKIENVHCPFGNDMMNRLWSDDKAFETLIMIQAAVDCCAMFHVKTLVVHPTDGMTPPPVSEEGVKYFQGIADYAARLGINIAFENIQRPEYLEVLFKKLNGKNIKFCYDSGHENCFSKGTDCLSEYGNRLCALHIHDNDGTDDSHLVPFDGNINYEPFLKKLCTLEYSGIISLEVMQHKSDNYSDYTPEDYISHAYDAAKHLAETLQEYKNADCKQSGVI